MDSLTPPIPDFNDPLGMILACHERMRAQCDTLEKLLPHIQQNGVDNDAKQAIRRVISYFNTSAIHHHQDEEEDVFPILMRQSLKLADRVNVLIKEHQGLNQSWDALKEILSQPDQLAENSEAATTIENFCMGYRSHLQHEEEDVLIMAPHILSRQQLDDIGQSMAKRRGTKRQTI